MAARRYVYTHPEQTGLGQHHADEPLASRPAQPPGVAASMRAAVAVMHPTEAQLAELDTFLGRTMHDLDLHHGTEVTHAGHDDERDLVLVEWTDQHGDHRVTSLTPAVFAEFFQEA